MIILKERSCSELKFDSTTFMLIQYHTTFCFYSAGKFKINSIEMNSKQDATISCSTINVPR